MDEEKIDIVQQDLENELNTGFDMENPNSGYSNPQIPLQSIRGWNYRGEKNGEPEAPKNGNNYFDTRGNVYRVYSSQQYDSTDTYVNGRATAYPYIVGNFVVHSNKLYECLIAHTSGVFAIDLAASRWIEAGAMITRRNPEYSNAYCNAMLAAPVSVGGGLTHILLNTRYTNDGYMSKQANSVTIANDGYYLFNALVKFATGSGDRHIWIYKNGVSIADTLEEGDYYYYEDMTGGGHTVYTSHERHLKLTWMARCSKDDLIDLYVQQTSGGNINVTPVLQVYKLSW